MSKKKALKQLAVIESYKSTDKNTIQGKAPMCQRCSYGFK